MDFIQLNGQSQIAQEDLPLSTDFGNDPYSLQWESMTMTDQMSNLLTIQVTPPSSPTQGQSKVHIRTPYNTEKFL